MRILLLIAIILSLLTAVPMASGENQLFHWLGYFFLGTAGLLTMFRWRTRLESAPQDLCLLAALLFTLWVFTRASFSPISYLGRADMALVVGSFLIYITTATLLSFKQDRLALFSTLALLALGAVGVSCIHLSGNWDFFIIPGYNRSFDDHRIAGFHNVANHAAAYWNITLMLTLGVLLMERTSKKVKILLTLLAILCAIGICLTKSRAGLLSMAAAGSLLALFAFINLRSSQQRNEQLRKKLLIGLSAGTILSLAALVAAGAMLLSTRLSDIGKDEYRMTVLKIGLEQCAEAPIVGTGSRTFASYWLKNRPGYDSLRSDFPDPHYIHNEYLQLLAEYGFVALLLLLVALALHYRNGISFLKATWNDNASKTETVEDGPWGTLGLCAGAIAAIAAMLIHALFDLQLHLPSIALPTALCFGILANPGNNHSSESSLRVPGLRFFCKILTIVAGCWLLAASIRYGSAEYRLEQARRITQEDGFSLEAIGLINKTVESDPSNYHALLYGGNLWLKSIHKKMPPKFIESVAQRALNYFDRATQAYPNQTELLIAKGDTLDALGRTDEAEQTFAQALAAAPMHRPTRLALGKHYHRLGDFEKATHYYREAHYHGRNDELNRYSRKLRRAAAQKKTISSQ